MIITRKIVAEKIVAYLRREITLAHLVNWAENIMMEGSVEDKFYDKITKVVCRIGLADVKAFGLMWDDCQKMLHTLGCDVKINVKLVA